MFVVNVQIYLSLATRCFLVAAFQGPVFEADVLIPSSKGASKMLLETERGRMDIVEP